MCQIYDLLVAHTLYVLQSNNAVIPQLSLQPGNKIPFKKTFDNAVIFIFEVGYDSDILQRLKCV